MLAQRMLKWWRHHSPSSFTNNWTLLQTRQRRFLLRFEPDAWRKRSDWNHFFLVQYNPFLFLSQRSETLLSGAFLSPAQVFLVTTNTECGHPKQEEEVSWESGWAALSGAAGRCWAERRCHTVCVASSWHYSPNAALSGDGWYCA